MKLKTCPACGEPSSGFFKLCAACQRERNIPDGSVWKKEGEEEG